MMAPLRFGRPHAAAAAVLLIAATAAFSVPTFASDRGVPVGPGCTCHNDLPSTAVNITALGWPAIYTPLESYTITLSGEGDVVGDEAGFSALVSKGTLSSPDPNVAAAGDYATHTNPDQRSWVIVWLAPPEDSGGATLAVFVNLVDGDGAENTGDLWNGVILTTVEKAPGPPKPSNLNVTFEAGPDGPIAGQNFSVVATLTNFTQVPIPNAAITFSFLASFGTLPLGIERTDANGTARLNFSTVAAGQFALQAHYDGSSKNQTADANATLMVEDPNHLFEEYYGRPEIRGSGILDPVRLPLGLIVGGVWLTFAFAGLQVLRVRKAGEPSNDGPREVLRLLIPKLGVLGRKKQ